VPTVLRKLPQGQQEGNGMAAARFRLQVKFWLDLHKPEESELAELIADLKAQRTFSRVVRDGICLMVDLCQGNLDVLLALFPWVEDAFYERFAAQQPASDHALQEQFAKLERLLTAQGNAPTAATGDSPNVAQHTRPDGDEGMVPIKQAKSSGNSAQNFLDAAFNLVQ
jgi:hypothetical protein